MATGLGVFRTFVVRHDFQRFHRQGPIGLQRQKILVLWLQDSALDSGVVAWSLWDGTGKVHRYAGDEDAAPYRTGLQAMLDGWRLFQASGLHPHYPETETQTAYLKYEFWFEQLVDVSEAAA